jgi:hypothetical protein
MIQEATSRVATLWRHGIGLSARSDSDPVERVTWFCYQIKKWYHYPARGLAFQRQRYSVCFLSFLIYSRSILCWSLDHRIFKLSFKLYLLPRDPNLPFIAYSSYLTWIFCNFCFILHLQFIAMLACIYYVHDYVSRYLLLALNFFVHLLNFSLRFFC